MYHLCIFRSMHWTRWWLSWSSSSLRPFVNKCKRQETLDFLTIHHGPGPEPGLLLPPRTKFFTYSPTQPQPCVWQFVLCSEATGMIVQQFSKLALCRHPCSSRMRRLSYHTACSVFVRSRTEQQLLSDQNGDKQQKCSSKLMKSKNDTLEISPPSSTSRM